MKGSHTQRMLCFGAHASWRLWRGRWHSNPHMNLDSCRMRNTRSTMNEETLKFCSFLQQRKKHNEGSNGFVRRFIAAKMLTGVRDNYLPASCSGCLLVWKYQEDRGYFLQGNLERKKSSSRRKLPFQSASILWKFFTLSEKEPFLRLIFLSQGNLAKSCLRQRVYTLLRV